MDFEFTPEQQSFIEEVGGELRGMFSWIRKD